MGLNVPAHYVTQYSTNVQLLLQQKGSKLRDTVSIGMHTGEAAVPVEQIGAIEAKVRAGRGSPVVFTDSPETRRWVEPIDYDTDAEIIDSADKLRMLIDPQSSYVTNAVYALGRKIDDVVIAAATATAKIGENSTSGTEAFDTATYQVTGSIGGTNSGLNVAKLRAARRKLQEAFVDLDQEQPTLVITARQHDDLLNEIQVISTDFGAAQAPVLVEGRIRRFLGINFVHTQLLTTGTDDAAGTSTACPLWVPSGMYYGNWQTAMTDISQRKDLQGLPWQAYVSMTGGATRLEKERVVRIWCR